MGNWPTSDDDSTTIGAPTKVNVSAITDATKQYDADNHNAILTSFTAMQKSLGAEGSAITGIQATTDTDTTSIRYRIEGRMISRYGGSEPATLYRFLTAATLSNASSLLFNVGHTATTADSFVSLWQVGFDTATTRGYVGASYGGTGQTVYAVGDILYASTTTALSKLAAGTSGYVLTAHGAGVAPTWETGIAAPLTLTLDDAVTNTWSTIATLAHTSSGTVAASFAARLAYTLEDAGGTSRSAAGIDALWTTATGGSATAAIAFSVMVAGATAAEVARLKSTGLLFAANGIGLVSTNGSGKVFTDDSTGSALVYSSSQIAVGGSQIQVNNHVNPSASAIIHLGTTALRYSEVCGTTGDFSKDSAATNTVTDILTLGSTSSGTAAAGIGVGILLTTEDAGGSVQNAGRVQATLTTATAGSEVSKISFQTVNGGAALATRFNVTGTGVAHDGSIVVTRTATAADYTVLITDHYVGVTSTAAARTITLPAAATCGAGFQLEIADESGGAGTNNITIDGNAAETINGAATVAIAANWGRRRLTCDGTNWTSTGTI